MVGKYSLVASLAAALILCATAELPTEENGALASEQGLEAANSALEFEENFEAVEDLRQKREALPEPKKGEKKQTRKNKGKKTKNGKKNNKKGGAKRKAKNKKAKNNKGKKDKPKDGRKNKNRKSNGEGKKKTKSKGKGSNRNTKKSKSKGKNKQKGAQSRKKGAKRNGKKKKGKAGKKGAKRNGKKKKGKAGKKGAKRNGKKNKGKAGKIGKRNNKKNSGKNEDRKKDKKSKNAKGKGKEKGKRTKKNNGKGKNKISGRKMRPKKNNKISRQSSNATVSLLCLKDAVLYTKFLKDQVINFLRRNTRLEAQNKLTSKKALKKGEFEEPMARVIQAGGGDRQNLSCGGSTKSVGAKQMKNITDILGSCNDNIKAACKPHKGNVTQRELCVSNAKKFNTTIVGCVATAIKGKDACSCFQAAEVAKEKKILESCKGTSDGKKAAAARTKCLKTLSKCKQAQTTAGTLQYSCGYSEAKLIGILKQLNTNLAAFKKLLEKIEALTGVKADPPGGGNSTSNRSRTIREEIEEENSQQSRNRGKRQTKPCADVLKTLSTCTTSIANAPSLPSTAVDCKEPTYTLSGTCTDTEKADIKKALNAAIITNGLIIGFIKSVQAELLANTGSTPSDADLTSTKKTAARSRSILRKMIMEKMQLHN